MHCTALLWDAAEVTYVTSLTSHCPAFASPVSGLIRHTTICALEEEPSATAWVASRGHEVTRT